MRAEVQRRTKDFRPQLIEGALALLAAANEKCYRVPMTESAPTEPTESVGDSYGAAQQNIANPQGDSRTCACPSRKRI
jgi:hypothetical protein